MADTEKPQEAPPPVEGGVHVAEGLTLTRVGGTEPTESGILQTPKQIAHDTAQQEG